MTNAFEPIDGSYPPDSDEMIQMWLQDIYGRRHGAPGVRTADDGLLFGGFDAAFTAEKIVVSSTESGVETVLAEVDLAVPVTVAEMQTMNVHTPGIEAFANAVLSELPPVTESPTAAYLPEETFFSPEPTASRVMRGLRSRWRWSR